MCDNNRVVKLFLGFFLICQAVVQAPFVQAYTAADFNAVPPFVSAGAPPLVMLVMGRDDKLYFPAYNDASDLNGDGVLDLFYNPNINYYGYFDSYKCYSYSSGNGRFEPASTTSNKQCSGQWSGDWLNYVTMSRLDTLRKVLYGGYRSVDSTTDTVLRRTYIPQDAHTWGKDYESVLRDGYDISKYTPLSIPTSGRHLFANTTLSDNGTPLLRVLPNNLNHIWDWVAKERPEGDDSLVSAGGNFDSYPSDKNQFASLVTSFANTAHFLGIEYPSQINGSGNPFNNPYDPGGLKNSDYYIDVFKGNLIIFNPGEYTFACDGDDAVEVLIDGAVVTGWYGGHGNSDGTAKTSYSAIVTLSAGSHTVEFHHQERQGGDNYYLYWKGPDSTASGHDWQIVPPAAFIAPATGLSSLSHSFYSVNTPSSTITDYTVQVQVCVPSMPESNCKLYSNGTTFKPIGLLQTHGESDRMLFGLLTGSYTKNLSGGVLRKNIGSIKDEINLTTGQFTPINGIISTINELRVIGYGYPDEGIQYYYWDKCGWIWDRPLNEGECRMWGNPIGEMMYETLRYFGGKKTPTGDFIYDYSDASLDDNVLGLPHPNWIDPYDQNNGGFSPCSKPFMLVLSDVNPSYDSNSIPGVNSNFGSMAPEVIGSGADPLNAKDLANFISTQEGITSGQCYIGQEAGNYDGYCSAKDITGFGLGDIRGLCPEDPSKQGSYYSAAVAYYGRTHNISKDDGVDQNVTTYAVGLASPLPRINIAVGSKTITLVPFGKTVGGCVGGMNNTKGFFQPTESIASFFVQSITPVSGKFRINYEDVEQGSDHDMDAIVLYEYQVVDSAGLPVTDPSKGASVTITLTSDYAAGCAIQHMGYIISGTTADGSYLEVRDSDTDSGADPDYYLDTPPGQSIGNWHHLPAPLPLQATRTFTPIAMGAAPAQILQNPLWYAAKWGGFESDQVVTANYVPQKNEWDKDGDGTPDTYFYVTNPLKLEEQLNKSFADILRRASSGTAASVISNSRSGEGAVYQSIFYPENRDGLGNTVNWVGDVHALLVDANGNIREDTNHNSKLDIAPAGNTDPTQSGDNIIVFNGTSIQKFADVNGNSIVDNTVTEKNPVFTGGMNDVAYLWTAGGWLNNLSDDDVVTQRTSYAPITLGSADLNRRYIFTFIDANQNMVPDSGEQQDFVCNSAMATADLTDTTKIYPYLNVYPPFESAAPSYIETIRQSNSSVFTDFLKTQTCREINFIRGQDQSQYISLTTPSYTLPAFRSRQFDYNNNNKSVTWRLGDIVYSTPTVVGRPSEGYHLLYQDTSYAEFLKQYLNRRNVVYVGSNDGMVHAFNAGFYDDYGKQFNKQLNGTMAPFALGAELWAYVPFNLLPHLYWLTESNYGHVYYVDQKPKIFDARIFPVDTDHPNGWGTVMVIGMRFGGGTVYADMNKMDGMGKTSLDQQMSSSFIVMDITNPEKPPKVLAELKFPGLGYTTCYPAVIPMGQLKGSTSQNDWYLVFGSGPAEADGTAGSGTSLQDAASVQSAKLYVVDLKALNGISPVVKTLNSTGASFNSYPTNGYYQALDTNAFVSDPIVVDYQLDYKADAVYFGTVSGNQASGWGGKLRRIVIDNNPNTVTWKGDSVLLDDQLSAGMRQPITSAPTIAVDTVGNRWAFFGTGRFFVRDDAKTANFTQQTYYGVREPFTGSDPTAPTSTSTWTWGAVSPSDLLDVSGIHVFTDKTVVDDKLGSGINSWDSLTTDANSKQGWKLNFSRSGERNIGQATLLGSTLTFTTYVPSTDICSFEGQSYLYALYYTTGTSYFKNILTNQLVGSKLSISNISLGLGLAATPNLHVGGEAGSEVFVQDSTGEIKTINQQNATPAKSGLESWRLIEN